MKKRAVLIGTISLIIIVIYLLSLSNSLVTGEVVFTPTISQECSDTSIRATWDSVFKESSNGITVFINTTGVSKCQIFAYKIKGEEAFIMTRIDPPSSIANLSTIGAIHGNFTSAYLSILSGISNFGETNDAGIDLGFFTEPAIPSQYITSQSIETGSEANSKYSATFENSPPAWEINDAGNRILYSFNESESSSSENKENVGRVFLNYTIEDYVFNRAITPTCNPYWISQNTSCQSNDKYIIYYSDSNSCESDLGRPTNKTLHCDYGRDGIVGNFSDLDTSRISLSVYINGTRGNSSKNYSSSREQKIELKSGSKTIIEFDWNFASSALNLDEIYVQKQTSSSAGLGYLLIRGISAEKTILVNKINASSDKICIKDEEVDSINELSNDCTGTNEILIGCPRTGSDFSCSLEENGTYFKISGLKNSVAREFLDDCIPNWSCTSWSSCSNDQQIRTCTDSNSCGISFGRPNLNQSCGSGSCTPDWECTAWNPAECPENETQTRACTDSNSCGTDLGKSPETKTCELDSGNSLWIWIIIILVIIFVIIGILVWWFILRKGGQGGTSSQQSAPQSPPPSTPQVAQKVQAAQQAQTPKQQVTQQVQAAQPTSPVQQPATPQVQTVQPTQPAQQPAQPPRYSNVPQ
jgi:hypothetical protein